MPTVRPRIYVQTDEAKDTFQRTNLLPAPKGGFSHDRFSISNNEPAGSGIQQANKCCGEDGLCFHDVLLVAHFGTVASQLYTFYTRGFQAPSLKSCVSEKEISLRRRSAKTRR
jgi:hypothetical protein